MVGTNNDRELRCHKAIFSPRKYFTGVKEGGLTLWKVSLESIFIEIYWSDINVNESEYDIMYDISVLYQRYCHYTAGIRY